MSVTGNYPVAYANEDSMY